ncbi:hypothetical protein KIN_07010 [Litoreibacter roseus]|uniref:Uncharacterized protein n=1 Tax=Litoreibacter roseus TaxID=2601869 RepID=A0A6N6JCB6_9RHOB|nr:hypothetical protein KIN_07010 [Litoreibacter roseus]
MLENKENRCSFQPAKLTVEADAAPMVKEAVAMHVANILKNILLTLRLQNEIEVAPRPSMSRHKRVGARRVSALAL